LTTSREERRNRLATSKGDQRGTVLNREVLVRDTCKRGVVERAAPVEGAKLLESEDGQPPLKWAIFDIF
jgi:hypothetical protein